MNESVGGERTGTIRMPALNQVSCYRARRDELVDALLHTQTNQPAITGGNATFVQYFSVRQTPRQCGTITISEHKTSTSVKLAARRKGGG
jgi:hypothetical protein